MTTDSKALYPFEALRDKELFDKLTHELRCTVCPNQNIAESASGLAMDMKNMIYQQVRSHRTEQEVVQLMKENYGEQVLYRPLFHSGTYLLWFFPVILVSVGLMFFLKHIKRSECRKS